MKETGLSGLSLPWRPCFHHKKQGIQFLKADKSVFICILSEGVRFDHKWSLETHVDMLGNVFWKHAL